LSDWVLAVLPLTAPLMFKAPPAVVRVTSSVNVTPVAEPTVASPKLMTPTPLVLICPAALIVLGDVAVRPPAKVNTSLALLPNVRVPVLLNTVGVSALETLVLLPSSAKLYPLAVVVSVGVVRLSWKVMV